MMWLGLLALYGGGLLAYSGMRDVDPREVVRAIFTASPMPAAGSASGGGTGSLGQAAAALEAAGGSSTGGGTGQRGPASADGAAGRAEQERSRARFGLPGSVEAYEGIPR